MIRQLLHDNKARLEKERWFRFGSNALSAFLYSRSGRPVTASQLLLIRNTKREKRNGKRSTSGESEQTKTCIEEEEKWRNIRVIAVEDSTLLLLLWSYYALVLDWKGKIFPLATTGMHIFAHVVR